MKIAFTTKGTDWESPMDARFGRAPFILVYDDSTDTFSSVDNSAVENVAHGAGPQTAQKVFDLNPDILITGNGPGGNAATVLTKAGLKIYIGAGDKTVRQAYDAYKNGELKAF